MDGGGGDAGERGWGWEDGRTMDGVAGDGRGRTGGVGGEGRIGMDEEGIKIVRLAKRS